MAYAEQLPSGRWRGVYRDADGRRRYAAEGTKENSWPSKKIAKNWADEQEADVRRGKWQDPAGGKRAADEWIAEWWGHHRTTLEASSIGTERSRVNNYLLTRWGDLALADITHTAVRAWTGSLRKEGLAEWTVTGIVALFSQCIQAAVDEGLLGKNPCKGVKLIRPRHTSIDVDWPESQLEAILAELEEPWDLLAGTKAWHGLRWGELTGLHATKLDLMRGFITIRHTLVERESEPPFVKEYPKDEDERIVPIAPHLLPALAAHAGGQARDGTCGLQHRRRNKVVRCPGGQLLFTCWRKRYGTEPEPFVSRHAFNKRWHAAIKAANVKIKEANKQLPALERTSLIPDGRPNDLRHFYGTWLVGQGVPLYDVQQLMGHSDPETTKRYLPAGGLQDHHKRALAALTKIKGQNVGRNAAHECP